MWQDNKPRMYGMRTGHLALMVLLIAYVGLDIASVVVMLATGITPDVTTLLIIQMLSCIPMLLILLLSAHPVPAMRWSNPGFKNVLYSLALAFFVSLGMSVLLNFISHLILLSGKQLPDSVINNALTQMPFWLQMIFLCVFAPFTEEMLFRGALQNAYERRFGFSCFILAGLLFGWMHGEPLSILNGVIVGWMMGYVYLRTRSIWAPILYHAFHNFLAATAIPSDYVLHLPWTLELYPEYTMSFHNPSYVLYQCGIAAIAVLMSYVFLRLIKWNNQGANALSHKSPVYYPERGSTVFLIISLVLLAVRTLPSIALYVLM